MSPTEKEVAMDVGFLLRNAVGDCYTGIGSRSTPPPTLALIRAFAEFLAVRGWVVRSGAAPGADEAFEAGARAAHGVVRPYLPWFRFQGVSDAALDAPSAAAVALAERFHPAWDRCGRGARLLHGRNCHQVLGDDLDSPSCFVSCWTPDGSVDGSGRHVGGTGQALRIASSFGVPVINLARDEHRLAVEAVIREVA
jgi:hypothetical protein